MLAQNTTAEANWPASVKEEGILITGKDIGIALPAISSRKVTRAENKTTSGQPTQVT